MFFPLNACALSMETDIKQIGHNAVKSKNALRRTATKTSQTRAKNKKKPAAKSN